MKHIAEGKEHSQFHRTHGGLVGIQPFCESAVRIMRFVSNDKAILIGCGSIPCFFFAHTNLIFTNAIFLTLSG